MSDSDLYQQVTRNSLLLDFCKIKFSKSTVCFYAGDSGQANRSFFITISTDYGLGNGEFKRSQERTAFSNNVYILPCCSSKGMEGEPTA